MKYLSEQFNENDFKSWDCASHILIIADTGNGKTTLMLDKFTLWAEKQGKRVLYLYNRQIMKAQFAEKKASEHENLEIFSYQAIEVNEMGVGLQEYINTFDFVLCDECHYFISDSSFNINTFLSFDAVNNCKGTVIYFTATPKYFLNMKNHLAKPLKIIDKSGLNPKNVKKIYLAKNRNEFDEFEEKTLENSKVIHFENNTKKLTVKALKYSNKGYKTAIVLSELSKDAEVMNTEVAKQIKNSTDENGNEIQNVFVNWLGCTSAYENGVNFNIEGAVTVSFARYMNWTSLEQSRSRVRNFKDNSVSMLVCLPHKAFLNNVVIEKENKIGDWIYGRETTDKTAIFGADAYNQYNDFRIAFQEFELEEIKEILNAEDKIEYYKEKLKEIYPDAEICMLHEIKSSFIDFDEIMQSFIGAEVDEAYLCKDEQNRLGEIFKKLNFAASNANRKFGVNRISKELEKNGSIFGIETKNKRIDGKVQNTWHVYRK
ncbi:DEAD/DEAH box helicase family protein [Rummeliibacillus stabekisii]|uniref:DEAD/DEAH box helicase family protein n=1 Tax=Rummeliibacillus stabekisii TaxID=241244 RepID=UPI003719509D